MRPRSPFALSLFLLLGCPNKDSSSTSPGSSATATASAVVSAAPGLAPETNLAPLSDNPTGPAPTGTAIIPSLATAAAAKPKASVSALSSGAAAAAAATGATNGARIKQCCDALRKSTAMLAPASTEAQTLTQAATLCDGIAAASATAPATVGQMPEFAPVRQLLQSMQSKPLPGVCQSL